MLMAREVWLPRRLDRSLSRVSNDTGPRVPQGSYSGDFGAHFLESRSPTTSPPALSLAAEEAVSSSTTMGTPSMGTSSTYSRPGMEEWTETRLGEVEMVDMFVAKRGLR